MNVAELPTLTDAALCVNQTLHHHVYMAESMRSMCGEDMGLTDEQFDRQLADHDLAVEGLHGALAALEGHTFADYVLNVARVKAIRRVGGIGETEQDAYDA